MPGEKWSSLRSGLRWLADKLAILLAGSWSTLLVGYVVYPDFRAWVWRLVGRVGELVPAAIAIAGVASVVYVVVRYWRWVLWRVAVRPASRAFGLEANEKPGGMTPAFADLLRDQLRALDADSLWVLEGALARRKPGSNEAVLEYPDGMRLEPRESGAGMARPRFEKALDKLKHVGAISSWQPVGREHTRNFSIKVLLPTADWRTLERLRVLAEVEWARKTLSREIRDYMIASLAEKEDASTLREESAWDVEARALPRLTSWLLHLILWEYSRQPQGDVYLLHADLNALALQFKVSLPKVRQACAELVDADFLLKFQWRDDENGIMLVATLAERVGNRKVAEELMYALDRRVNTPGGLWE